MEVCRQRMPAFFLRSGKVEFKNDAGNCNRRVEYSGSSLSVYGVYGYRGSFHDGPVRLDEYVQVSPDESAGYGS